MKIGIVYLNFSNLFHVTAIEPTSTCGPKVMDR